MASPGRTGRSAPPHLTRTSGKTVLGPPATRNGARPLMTAQQPASPMTCAMVFEAADPPRTGRLALWRPDGGAPPGELGEPGELTIVEPSGDGVRTRRVAAVRVRPERAVPLLAAGAADPAAHPATHPAAAF